MWWALCCWTALYCEGHAPHRLLLRAIAMQEIQHAMYIGLTHSISSRRWALQLLLMYPYCCMLC